MSLTGIIHQHNRQTQAQRAAGAIQDARRILPRLTPNERAYVAELAAQLIAEAQGGTLVERSVTPDRVKPR